MTIFTRLLETITGRPHQRQNARRVADAANDLRRDVGALSSRLRPYTESDDPLVALMTDVFNQRQMRDNGRTRGS